MGNLNSIKFGENGEVYSVGMRKIAEYTNNTGAMVETIGFSDLNLTKLRLYIKVPQVETAQNYSYLVVNGVQSGFATVGLTATSVDALHIIELTCSGDFAQVQWFVLGATETKPNNFTKHLGAPKFWTGDTITSIGVKSYQASNAFPDGTVAYLEGC